ncbi:MAG: hypothetical protein DMG13_14380 [Acidobacteria bacterium]|nr:MAG: hypothetical protein DMG13_14380 [Acidobacteriota bacterium]
MENPSTSSVRLRAILVIHNPLWLAAALTRIHASIEFWAASEATACRPERFETLSLCELVTLSACDTGSGKLLGQGGFASLERAFLVAGARAVIARLWLADDTFTIALMKGMYQHLADGADEGATLRKREETDHGRYFIVVLIRRHRVKV